MLENPIFLYVVSGILAFIPVLVWLGLLFKNSQRKGLQGLLFFGSIFSVVPVFLLHYFLNIFPQFDVLLFLQQQITNQNLNFVLLFISVGIVEEIVKQSLIRVIDRKYLLIKTINESIQYSLIGALGFSFAENIFYIYSIYTQLGIQQLFVAYIFRSIFTTCAHLIFSGFFGYYYGIAKFSLNVVEQNKLTGKKQFGVTLISKIFQMSKFESYKQISILKGLSVAIGMHAVFNLLLQFNQIIPVVLYVCASFYLLMVLLKRKSGKLVLVSGIDDGHISSMAKTDEDVVLELLGMWFENKRFVDVIHICQRLLERDPDNQIVQLFKAKALDKLGTQNVYGKMLSNLFPEKTVKSLADIAKERPLIQVPVMTQQDLENMKKSLPEKQNDAPKEPENYFKLKL